MVFTANPEDYTARRQIVTPLKDRIGSEIRTHYPESLDEAITITEQEAWTARSYEPGNTAIKNIIIPHYIRQIVEQVRRRPRAMTKKSTSAAVSRSAFPSAPWNSSSPTPSAAPSSTANRS